MESHDDLLAILRSCSAVPNFIHIFNILAKDYLSLPELDISEYEHCLLPFDPKYEDLFDPFVLPNIIIKFLKGCGQAYVREDTCFDILKNLISRKWNAYSYSGIPCPFLQEKTETVPEAAILSVGYLDFHSLQPVIKAECLLVLLNCWMLNHLVKTNFIDNIEAEVLRISSVGQDARGCKYFYLCGTRLYKESNFKYDGVNATGTFDWELIAKEPEDFASVLADLKKQGATSKTRPLISALENKIIPNLPAQFDMQKTRDLERRMVLRRRRSIAKEKARKERQELLALKKRARESAAANQENGGPKNGGLKMSRAERYKRRAMMAGLDDSGSGGEGSVVFKTMRKERPQQTREELLNIARKLLAELFKKITNEWPALMPHQSQVHESTS